MLLGFVYREASSYDTYCLLQRLSFYLTESKGDGVVKYLAATKIKSDAPKLFYATDKINFLSNLWPVLLAYLCVWWGIERNSRQKEYGKVMKTQRKNPFGAMVMARDRTLDQPMYQTILTKHGFLNRNADVATAYLLFTRLAEDKIVTKMAREIEQPNKRYRLLASIVSGYSRYAQVLAKMTPRQKKSLKTRLGVQ